MERTAERIASLYAKTSANIAIINRDKRANETEEYWKERIKRNWQHLEKIKAYKKADKTTSIWTTEDFTEIDAAIIKGKAIQA